MTPAGFESTAPDAEGLATKDHWYVSGPPLGLNEALPSRVTLLLTGTVWLNPPLATGFRRDHCRLATVNGTVVSTRIVKVSVLVTAPLVGTGGKCSVFLPATICTLGERLVTVAVSPD